MHRTLDERLEHLVKMQEEEILPECHYEAGELYINHPKLNGKNRKVLSSSHVEDLLIEAFGRKGYLSHPLYMEGDVVIATLKEAKKLESSINRSAFTPHETEKDYIKEALPRLGYSQDDKGLWVLTTGQGSHDSNYSSVMDSLKIDMNEYNKRIPIIDGKPAFHRLNDGLLPASLNKYLEEKNTEFKDNIRKELRYDGSSDEDLTDVVSDLLRIYYIEQSPENIIMFKHMLWSIKRQLYRLPIDFPVMFCFYSIEGGLGKSYLARALAPYPAAYGPGQLDTLGNDRDRMAMVRDKLIVNFDELATGSHNSNEYGNGLTSAMISKIKEALTATMNTARNMYAATQGSERQPAVFLSTANIHIYDLIQDTAMRRYYEFVMEAPSRAERAAQGKLEFYKEANKYLNKIKQVYQMVDEGNDEGYYHSSKPLYTEIGLIQDNYAKKDAITLFLAEKGRMFATGPVKGAEWITADRLRAQFCAWRTKRGEREYGATYFTTIIKDHHHTPLMKVKGGAQGYWWTLVTKAEEEEVIQEQE